MNNKAHLTIEGLNQIVNIKASMNLGLSDKLKAEFKGYSPVERPVVNNEKTPDPSHAGRRSRDGCDSHSRRSQARWFCHRLPGLDFQQIQCVRGHRKDRAGGRQDH